jgi:nicotinamide mononucleotide transporter
MVFSFIATWLTARKVLESWVYWIAIDLIAAVMYGLKGLQPTVFLYVIYALVAVYGFYSWRKMKVQHG